MKKNKIIKDLTKKYLFESFTKESYGYHGPKFSAEKHSCYKRSLVTNKVTNKQTKKAA